MMLKVTFLAAVGYASAMDPIMSIYQANMNFVNPDDWEDEDPWEMGVACSVESIYDRREDGCLYSRETGKKKDFQYQFRTVMGGPKDAGKLFLFESLHGPCKEKGYRQWQQCHRGKMTKPIRVKTNSPFLSQRLPKTRLFTHIACQPEKDGKPNYAFSTADGIFLVFDVNNRASWEAVWAEYLALRRDKRYPAQGPPKVVSQMNYQVMIVGNKTDLDKYVPDARLAVAIGKHYLTGKNIIADKDRKAKFQYEKTAPALSAEQEAVLKAKQQELEQAKKDNNKIRVTMIQGEIDMLNNASGAEKTPGLLKLDKSILRKIFGFILKPERANGLTLDYCRQFAHAHGCHYFEVNRKDNRSIFRIYYNMAKALTEMKMGTRQTHEPSRPRNSWFNLNNTEK